MIIYFRSFKLSSETTAEKKQKTYVATPFPVHYCGLALPAVPYNHVDSAPLRILAKLLTSKFLLSEIREKGGAYGGGATSSPISGKSFIKVSVLRFKVKNHFLEIRV